MMNSPFYWRIKCDVDDCDEVVGDDNIYSLSLTRTEGLTGGSTQPILVRLGGSTTMGIITVITSLDKSREIWTGLIKRRKKNVVAGIPPAPITHNLKPKCLALQCRRKSVASIIRGSMLEPCCLMAQSVLYSVYDFEFKLVML